MPWGDEDNNEDQQRQMSDQDFANASRKLPICRYFSSRRGCLKGDNCVFSHETPVCAFFRTGCTNDNCAFVHDMSQEPSSRLKQCPTDGCTNSCLGKICRECHRKIARNRSRSPNQTYRTNTNVRRASPSPPPQRRERSRRHSMKN
jgi:hypothetical protein